jgi:hypothetical protein
MTVRSIYDKQWEFKQDEYGRVHTNLTHCVTEARAYLHISGENFVGVDIRNSQPLFFCRVLMDTLTGERGGEDCGKQQDTTLSVVELATAPSSTNPLYMTSSFDTRDKQGSNDALDDTTKCFISLCENGTLYEYILKRYRRWRWGRNLFKRFLFKYVFYGPIRHAHQHGVHHPAQYKRYKEITAIFEDEFPEVWDFILKVKRKNYKILSHLMQKAESDLVINKVCARIMEERPDVPILTIHDSVLTFRRHVEYVKGVLLEELRRIGLNGSVKVEDYAKE